MAVVAEAGLRLQTLSRAGYESLTHALDSAAGLDAYIAIHDTTLGPALGGTRMWAYASAQEAVTDALRLARGMTFKSALANLPHGGGKGVIVGDPKGDKSEVLMAAYGRFVDSFRGRFITGEDVGIGVADVAVMEHETAHLVGREQGGGDPSPVTALGVLHGIEAALNHRLGGPRLAGVTVAVQGLGHVGLALCDLLDQAGARLVVADIDADAVARAREALGAEVVAPEKIYDADATVFAPCALGAVLDDETIPRLRCAAVAGAANNQLLDDRHGEALRARGILYAPDYVINAGGLINAAAELRPGGYDRDWARAKVAEIGPTLGSIFEHADHLDATTNAVADRLARQRLAHHRADAVASSA
jgi:leucine dehydrogenase